MKINKIIFNCFIAVVLTCFGCKKSHEYTIVNTTDDTAAQTIIASDELEVNRQFDIAVDDAIKAYAVISTTTAGNILLPNAVIAGALLDTSQLSTGIFQIFYFGKTADGTIGRTGSLIFKLPVIGGNVIPWETKGVSATLVFDQYEVIVVKTPDRQLWFNGTSTITNVSGGLLSQLVPGDSLVDKVRAEDLSFSYNDNVIIIITWTWHYNRTRVFNSRIVNVTDTFVTASIKGDTVINNINNVVTWGKTRSEQKFYTTITTPLVYNISGSALVYDPLKGRKVILGIKYPITITYGVNRQGIPINSSDPYGYIITWTDSIKQAKQAVVQYGDL